MPHARSVSCPFSVNVPFSSAKDVNNNRFLLFPSIIFPASNGLLDNFNLFCDNLITHHLKALICLLGKLIILLIVDQLSQKSDSSFMDGFISILNMISK
jgi:hypothetical protein